jgi:HSP20 family protein
MQREINRMFDSFFREGAREDSALMSTGWSPALDLTETDDSFVVKVELPGVNKNDVKVSIQDNILTIGGEKKQEKESKTSNYHRVERCYGSFRRSFALPSNVRSDSIDASHKDGVLTVTLPKAEEAKRKEIEVRVM